MVSQKMKGMIYVAVLLFSSSVTAHSASDDQPDVSVRGGGGYRGGYERSPAVREDEQRAWRNDYNAYPGGGGVNVEYAPPYNPYGTDPNEQGTTWDDSSYSQLQKEGP